MPERGSADDDGGGIGPLIADFTADLKEAWRKGGAGATWDELREWLLYPAARHGKLLLIEQTLPEAPAALPPPGIRIERLETRHWEPLSAICTRRDMRRQRLAFDRGRIGLVAMRDDRAVGHTWFSQRMDIDLELYPLELAENAVYGWNLFVHPGERGSGIGSALVSARMDLAKRMGFEATVRVIDPENLAAIGTVRNSGESQPARVLGMLYYLKIFGWVPHRLRPIEEEEIPL